MHEPDGFLAPSRYTFPATGNGHGSAHSAAGSPPSAPFRVPAGSTARLRLPPALTLQPPRSGDNVESAPHTQHSGYCPMAKFSESPSGSALAAMANTYGDAVSHAKSTRIANAYCGVCQLKQLREAA